MLYYLYLVTILFLVIFLLLNYFNMHNYYLIFVSFSQQLTLMVFHWIMSNSKFSHVSRTLLSILVGLNDAVVWIASTHPLISKSSIIFSYPSVAVPRAPLTISIIVTFYVPQFFIIVIVIIIVFYFLPEIIPSIIKQALISNCLTHFHSIYESISNLFLFCSLSRVVKPIGSHLWVK